MKYTTTSNSETHTIHVACTSEKLTPKWRKWKQLRKLAPRKKIIKISQRKANVVSELPCRKDRLLDCIGHLGLVHLILEGSVEVKVFGKEDWII